MSASGREALASWKRHEAEQRIRRDESAKALRALAKADPAAVELTWLALPAPRDEDGSVPARTGP